MYMPMTQCERTIIYPEAMTSFGGVNKISLYVNDQLVGVRVMLRAFLRTLAVIRKVATKAGRLSPSSLIRKVVPRI